MRTPTPNQTRRTDSPRPLLRAGELTCFVLVVLIAVVCAACTAGAQPTPAATPTAERMQILETHVPPTAAEVMILSTAPTLPPTRTPTPRPETGKVFDVIDGDTISVQIGGQIVTVRFLLADAPETNAPLSDASTQANRDIVTGRRVRLVRDISDVDSEGRLLRYVYLDDGTFVNETIVRRGWARVVAFAPDTQKEEQLLRAQDAALDEGLGIWASLRTPVTARTAILRSGPGLVYAQQGELAVNTPLQIDAVSPLGDWYRLIDGFWIAAADVIAPPADDTLNRSVSLVAVPSLAPTSTLTPIATPTPLPTITPFPAGFRAATTVVIEWINRSEGYVVLRNDASIPISLDNWKLVTDYSRQICFLYGVLYPGDRLTAWARTGTRLEISCNFPDNIWNTRQAEPALLFAPTGEVVSKAN